MARNPRPPQEITDRWAKELAALSKAARRRKQEAAKAQAALHDAVRSAFSEGVLVGTMTKATGLSGSRLFQIKFELAPPQPEGTPAQQAAQKQIPNTTSVSATIR